MGTPVPGAGAGSGNVRAGSGEARGAFDAGMFPLGRRPWGKWVADHNPLLLLSTLLMLVGCGLANWALREASDNVQMLVLLGVINVYEGCLIPLGLALIRRSRGTARDGLWLVLFEALILANTPLMNSRMGPAWVVPLEAGLWVLACVKAAVVLRGLKMGLGMRTFGFLALQLGVIYALPVVFAIAAQDIFGMDGEMYGMLWVAGLLPVMYDVVARVRGREERWDVVQNVVRRTYLIAPWCMLVLHLVFWRETCGYKITVAELGPVLLGLAALSRRVNLRRDWRMAVRFVPAAALVMTLMMQGREVEWIVRVGGETKEMTAVHFMLAGTILTYGYMGTLGQFLAGAGAVVALGLGYMFWGWIVQGVRAGVRVVGEWMPTTALGWSVVTIGAAFALLGIGGYLGLRRVGKEGGG